jgi:hypothetical protein
MTTATSSTTSSPAANSRIAQPKAYPTGGLRFDWIVTLLSFGIVAGVYLDGWAHSHGRTDDSFFTPWHAILYSAFAAAGLFLAFHQLRNVQQGYPFMRALPYGYTTSLMGAVLFALGGFADMLWHTQFGLEEGIVEILVSPSHLLLAMGGIVILSGPLRALWYRLKSGEAQRWQEIAPLIVSVGLCVAGLTFFTQYAHPYRGNLAAVDAMRTRDDILRSTQGVSSFIIHGAILMAGLLLIAGRWKLPFGWATLITLIGTGMITVMDDHYWLIPAAILGGLLIDVLYLALRPHQEDRRYYAFGALAPLLYFGVYLAWLHLFRGGLDWRVHTWSGTLMLMAVIGTLIAFMYCSPLKSAEVVESE